MRERTHLATFFLPLCQASMNFLKFLSTALVLSMTCEFFYKVMAFFRPQILPIALFFYLLYFPALYQICKRVKSDVAYLTLAGALGLFGLEWWLVGNTPWGNPNASQLGMLIFHATVPFVARIFTDQNAAVLQKKMVRFWLGFSLFVMLGIVIQTPLFRAIWFIYLPLLGYTRLLAYVLSYIKARPVRSPSCLATGVS